MTELADLLVRRDRTLWPAASFSVTYRDWLEAPRRIEAEAAQLRSWADSIDQGTVVLLGEGGSVLGAAALAAAAEATGVGNGRRLVLCDTSDPETVASLPTDDAFFLLCSKSGSSLELSALLAHVWSKRADGRRYAAMTDPGTPLATEATRRRFARLFSNPVDVPDGYSVLSYPGMVPAAMVGYDPEELAALAMEADLEAAVNMGSAIGAAVLDGRDKLTIEFDQSFSSFGLWLEHLVATSTGKQGRGCVPVPTSRPESGPDRHNVSITPSAAVDLAAEFYRWELAVAIIADELGVDPFDQPELVESAGPAALLERLPLPEISLEPLDQLDTWLETNVAEGDYLSIEAYLPYGQDQSLERARRSLSDSLGGLATTAGYGPRLLHSTGQLHKDGPNSVVALQVLPSKGWEDLPIPGLSYDFAALVAAQAINDYQSLVSRGRRVLRIAVDDLSALG